MRMRLVHLFDVVCFALVLLVAGRATAAPQATILRIDPKAAQAEGSPVLSTVVELAQAKRLSEVLQDCAALTGDRQMQCMNEKLSASHALYTAFSDFPEKNAVFTVSVDGADVPAGFVDKHKFADSPNIAGVGTAWLILIDGSHTMGARLDDAKQVASAFVNAMGPQDIADVMVFGDSGVAKDTKWQPAAQKASLGAAVAAAQHLPGNGRARPLFTIIRNAVNDGFRDLGNAGQAVSVPYHQALVVLSDGTAGADPQSNGAGATTLAQYMSAGRFPPENTALPKTPLPVISVYFPTAGSTQEFTNNARDFMTNLANPETGGYFNVVRGTGVASGPAIVGAVRERFGNMFLVRYRVGCIAPTTTQSFKLNFNNVNPPILGDNTFKDVPIGIDPSVWPLSINVAGTTQQAAHDPVSPGGEFTVYGDFCWGSSAQRAQVYFIPAGSQIPQAPGHDIDAMKRVQQQLVASKMDGSTVKVSESSATFKAPDSERILWGKGNQSIVHVVVYDSGSRRMSGVTAQTILTLKAGESSLNGMWIAIGGFGLIVIALLLVILFRSGGGGGRRRGRPAANPAPVGPPGGFGGPPPFGGQPPPGGFGGPPPGGFGGPPPGGFGGGPPPGYGGPPPGGYHSAPADGGAAYHQTPPVLAPALVGPSGTAPAPQPTPPALGPELLYGGAPPQFGLTSGQPSHTPAPPDPYLQSGPAARATMSGSEGVFTVVPGNELRVGRDAARCQIVLQEPRVSSVHATVKIDTGSFVARDENSNNGTVVNGLRLQPGLWTPVPNGSLVRFGPTEFSVRLD